MFVSTSENVLSCLNLRDGGIAWRKLFSDGDDIDDVQVLDKPAVAVTLSGGGQYLRAWDQSEGFMKWEYLLKAPDSLSKTAASNLIVQRSAEQGGPALVVLINDNVQAIDSLDGEELWSNRVGLGSGESVHLLSAPTSVFVISYLNSDVTVLELSLSSGTILKSNTLTASGPLGSASAIGLTSLAVISQDGSQLCVVFAEGPSIQCQPLAEVAPQLSSSQNLELHAVGNAVAVVSQASGSALIEPSSSGVFKLLGSFSGVGTVAGVAELDSGDIVIGLVQAPQSGVVQLKVVSSSGEVVFEETAVGIAPPTLVPGSPTPALKGATLGTYKKKDKGAEGFRLLLSWQDAWLAMVQQGQLVWSRDEALGSVRQVMFSDLPTQQAEEAAAAGSVGDKTRMAEFLKYQMLSIKVQFHLASHLEALEFSRLRGKLSDKALPVRDVNGLRKAMLLMTGPGKLLALHNGDGRTMWSRFLAPLPGGSRNSLVSWRSFHDTTHSPQMAVLQSGPSGSRVVVIDTHSGEQLDAITWELQTTKVIALPQLHDGKAQQHVYLMLSATSSGTDPALKDSLQLQLVPDSPLTRSWLATHYRSVYFWLRSADDHALAGFGLLADVESRVGSPVWCERVWLVEYPEKLLSVVGRDPFEVVHSSVKILGDRSVQYKYLSPNVLFVALGDKPGSTSKKSNKLQVQLVDSVTGEVFYHAVHQGAGGPVHAMISENWVVYQYWSINAARFQMTVMEMFDSSPRPFDLMEQLFNANTSTSITSWQRALVAVSSQSYYARTPLKGLAVSRTAKGITSRQLLLLTHSDQVYSLDKRFLDPRRPMRQKLTTEEQEERLIPYMDTLPLMTTMFATYDKEVLGLRGAELAPSNLESTCLMLAHGVDLFYSRLAPAKLFDSLEDDFAYALLVLSLLGLFLGTIVVHYIAKRSILQQKWK